MASSGKDGARALPQAVLFDNDGTLVDTRALLLSSFRHATQQVLGKTFSEEQMMAGVGKPLADQMFDFTDDPDKAAELLAVYRAHNVAVHDRMVRTFPGIPELLAALAAAGVRLGVVTSKMHPLAERGLSLCGVMKYFDVLIGPDDWPEHKPAPGPVLRGLELVGADPARSVYVGDSVYDIHAGNAAGASTAAVLWGMGKPDALAAEHPTWTCATVAELAARLGV